MNKVYSRRNWQNEPSIATPLNDVNLNAMDYALDVVDTRVVNIDTTKANQSDLLQTVKSVTYNTTTGVFTFTFWNGTEVTVDLNIEKIPVSFSMSPQGVITMTTADGTEYTADVSELIKTYSFVDSSEIDFSVTTDASGNKDVTASIKAGSITGEKLQPNYLADCVSAKQSAESARDNAAQSSRDSNLSSQDSEAWAVGERNGQPVPSTDPAYQNNAKWWAQHGTGSSFAGLSDTNFTNLQNGQIAKYNSTTQKWENTEDEGGLLPHFYIDSEAGSTVTVTTPSGGTITPTLMSSGHWECDVPTYGTYIVHAVLNGEDATKTVAVNEVREYHITDTHFSYTLNVYAPQDSMIRIEATGETYTDTGEGSTPVVFSLGQKETQYTITVTYDGVSKTDSVTTPSTSGGTGSKTFEFGTINVTLDADFIGETITCVNGGTTISKTASTTSLVFYPPTTGTWAISGEVSGTTYTVDAEVTSLSIPVSVVLQTVPEGSTVLPTDDIQIWLACAGITDKSYTTLNEVLADSTTLLALISDNNASDYLVRSTTWASGITADSTAMTDIGANNYCANTLLSDSTWAKAIANSPYSDSVLNVKVPTMTSNTTPSGVADASVNATNAWKVFDKNFTTYWNTTSLNNYVEYEFTAPIKLKVISFISDYSSASSYDRVKNFKVEAYNGNDWDVLITDTAEITTSAVEQVFVCEGNNTYTRFRFYIIDSYVSNNIGLIELQFYGREDV